MQHNEKENKSLRALIEQIPIMLLAQVFVILVCVSLLAIDAFRTWDAYKGRVRENTVLSGNLVRSVAQNAEDTIKQADTVLVSLVDRIEKDGVSQAQLQRLQKLLVLHVGELPKLHGLFLYDENGRWLATNRDMMFNANNADREYFIYHRSHPEKAVYISKPVHSRSTGEWIIPVSRRINRPDGSFAGVMLATIHMKYFRTFYDTFNIGRDGTIALMHANGAIVAQRPFQDERIGMNLRETSLFKEHLPAASNGTYRADRTYFDDNDRLVSYYRLENYPLIAMVTMSEGEIFRPWWTGALKHLAVTLMLMGILGFLGYRLTHQIRYRLEVEKQLRDSQEKLEALNVELEKIAWQDGLTGLANRRCFDVALNDEFNQAMRRGESLALIMLDIDHFKKFNDLYGHIEGDNCLRQIGRIIKSSIKRAGDVAARYGGEEIVVLLPRTNLDEAVVVAERLMQEIRREGIHHEDSSFGIVTVSFGVHAIVPVRNQSIPSDLVQGADAALYAAKSAGRNRIISSDQRETL